MFIDLIKKDDGKLRGSLGFLRNSTKPVVLFGAGTAGEAMLRDLQKLNIPVDKFCDNDPLKHGTKYYGIEVISPFRLREEYSDAVVIVSIAYEAGKDVERQLEQMGCFTRIIGFGCIGEFSDYDEYVSMNASAFEELYDSLADEKSREVLVGRINCITTESFVFPPRLVDPNQYFDSDIIRFHRDEALLDAGAFDGQTALEFAGRAEGYKKIICMEPQEANFQLLLKNIAGNERIEAIKKGAWSKKDTFFFQSSGLSSRICENEGDEMIEVIPIDDILHNERVTMIKMDIEGAELEALKGAAKTIKRDKPRLAVCVYHKREDILEVPRYIRNLDNGYQIYLRHYGPSIFETVCYAVQMQKGA